MLVRLSEFHFNIASIAPFLPEFTEILRVNVILSSPTPYISL